MKTNKPSFQRVHYVLRPRKQIERKIIIELLQELQNKLGINISDYLYIGLGSIYYYDFILFHKFLNINDMISLDNKSCINRFEFNKPFDFICFKNLSTTDFLQSEAFRSDKNMIMWFDYDSQLIKYSGQGESHKFLQSPYIFDDIPMISNSSKQDDIFIITIDLRINRKMFSNVNVRQEFIDRFKPFLSKKYRNFRNITEESYPNVIQNIIMNTFRNNEIGKSAKFSKLFSFYYEDSTPMYTLGGIFNSKLPSGTTFKNEFFQLNDDIITKIEVPLLTYKEKIHLDQRIKYFNVDMSNRSNAFLEKQAVKKLGFEIDCIELKSYLKYYRYYPQYYEGII